VHEILADILEQQKLSGFGDLAGATASATIPVSDRVINELIARLLPPSGAVQEMQIEAEEQNRIRVRLRISAKRLTLPFSVMLHIQAQPALPQYPVLMLRLAGVPLLLSMAGPLTRFLDVLPPGITMDGDQIALDLQRLLAHQGQADLLQYLTDLRITTVPRRVVVSFQARVAP
jgi:hypothetical protein